MLTEIKIYDPLAQEDENIFPDKFNLPTAITLALGLGAITLYYEAKYHLVDLANKLSTSRSDHSRPQF